MIILVTIAPNGTIQLATPGSDGLQGLQAVTMANSGGAQQSTTILQYAQTPDGQQILVPSNQVVVQGRQIMDYSNKTYLFLLPLIILHNEVLKFNASLCRMMNVKSLTLEGCFHMY